MNRYILLVLCVLASSACGGGSDDESPGSAEVRFIQASADAPLVDVFVDDDQEFQRGVDFLEVRDYRGISADNRRLVITEASSFPLFTTESLSLEDGAKYSLISLDRRSEMDTLLLLDESTHPDSNRTSLRIIHAAVGVEAEIDVYVSHADDGELATEPTAGELAFKDVVPYRFSDADEYFISVLLTDSGFLVAESEILDLHGGQAYTLLIVDDLDGPNPINFLLVPDPS